MSYVQIIIMEGRGQGRGKRFHKNSNDEMVKLSKSLAWALRHGSAELGLNMISSGYVKLDELLSKQRFARYNVELIKRCVNENDKKRYDLAEIEGVLWIRANQGHTTAVVKDEDLLTLIIDPAQFPTVIHGTDKKAWASISKRGIYKMKRNHIHFAAGYPGEGQVISGARASCSVFIEIDMNSAINDGLKFYVSDNNVVLTSGIHGFVSPKYFKRIVIDNLERPFEFKPIDLDYILVLDFEANCIENAELKCQEIIEFPVQALNCKTLQVDFTFHHYIKPEVIPHITPFCTQLTGITQATVDAGISLPEALNSFQIFLDENQISSKRWIFLTCGDWDLKTCLAKEAAYKNINLPSYFNG